jgi:hypothetical protein
VDELGPERTRELVAETEASARAALGAIEADTTVLGQLVDELVARAR